MLRKIGILNKLSNSRNRGDLYFHYFLEDLTTMTT